MPATEHPLDSVLVQEKVEELLPLAGESSVLLVNDDPAQLLALEAVLADVGQNVVTARSGEEALRYVLKHDFALILLDVRMPGIDGFETAALIRQRKASAKTPIIFISAYDSSETHVSRGYSLGAVDYIHTPVISEVLRGKVSALVELHNKTQQVRRQAELLREKERLEYERKLAETKQREERQKERRIAEVLAEKAAELARSNADLDEFAHLAAHDLREPLRTIGGYSQELAKRYADDAEGRELVERIVEGVQIMDRLIADLYTYSQVGRRGKVAPTDCQKAFATVSGNLRAAIEESGSTLAADRLPTVMAVEIEVVRLLQNLVGNAIKFRRSEPSRVHVGAERRENEWLFSVRDNGIGIEPEYWERIFEPGERLHGKRRYHGTGLGLSICRKIVMRHGGRIWVESEPGKGSAFFFTLPAHDPVQTRSSPSIPAASAEVIRQPAEDA
jgi:signal transduction histidine kinase